MSADLRFERPKPVALDVDGDGADEVTLVYASEDSLFVEVIGSSGDLLARRRLYAGRDVNGDGIAEIGGRVSTAINVDADSYRELVVQVVSGYDKWPRAVVLYDWHADSVLWTFDVPSVSLGLGVSLLVAQSPQSDTAVCFVTSSVCNGHTVGPWDDCHCYLLCLDLRGNLRWHRTLGGQHANCQAVSVAGDRSHTRIIANRVADSIAGTPNLLYAYDIDGNVRDSLVLHAPLHHLASFTESGGSGPTVIASLDDNTALVLSDSLRVLYRLRSPGRILPLFRADILGLGRPQIALGISDRWLIVLDDDLRPLARLDNALDCSSLSALGTDATLLVRRDGRSVFFAPRRNSPVMALLLRYRMQLLFLAGIFATAAVVTLFYQRRTRQNLIQIRLQKTELEHTHQQLKDTQQKLVEAEKYKQAKDIAGAFAHEIRNALFPARYTLNRLGKVDPAGTVAEAAIPSRVQELNRSITRAIDLTNVISQYTRLDAEIRPESINVSEAVSSVLQEFRGTFAEHHIAVTVDGPPDAAVRIGRLHLSIILINLLRNAIEALNGCVDPSIAVRWERRGNKVRIGICDNGPGISPEIRDRIFDAFFTTRPNTGTGLGLATVKRLADIYNGTVTVEGTTGPGCCFHLELQGTNTD